MYIINQKFACFSILIISISFVFVQGILINSSAQGSQPLTDNVPKVIPIQDYSDNGIESSAPGVGIESEGTNQSTGGLPDTSSQGSSGLNNQTGGSLGDLDLIIRQAA